MKKIWIAILLMVCMVKLNAEEAGKPQIRLQVEMADAEVNPLGIQQKTMFTDLLTKLVQSNVPVGEDAQNPLLLFRLKSIEVGDTVIAFVQLAYFEQAELERNKSMVMAMTWSQATLVTTSKKEFAASVASTAMSMCSAFTLEYHKVFSMPQPK